jgi:hypothetical protein
MKRFIGVLSIIGILCTSVVFAATVKLSWTANTETDLKGYRVYRGAGACTVGPLQPLMVNGVPVELGKVVTYTDTTVPIIDGTVCYEITAIDLSLNESPRSNRATKEVSLVPPVAPKGLSVEVIP